MILRLFRFKFLPLAKLCIFLPTAILSLLQAASFESPLDAKERSEKFANKKRAPRRIELTEIRSYDGSGNNVQQPSFGSTNTPLLRNSIADYPDGIGNEIIENQRLNPRLISNLVCNQSGINLPNKEQMSDFIWAWGQFIDHDIDLTEVDPENGTADIPILDPADPLGPDPILFTRSNYIQIGERQQINEITAFIDGSNVYGSDEFRAQALRSFSGGRLLVSSGDLLPFNILSLENAGGHSASLFVAGDVRANENVVLTSLHTLFVREHNRLADALSRYAPEATDEEIYQLARKIVGAELQIITYEEFLPTLLGQYAPTLGNYSGYRSDLNPSINNEFSTAAFRMGHTMLSPNLMLAGSAEALPLRNAFFNPSYLSSDPSKLDQLLGGLTQQACQEIDQMIVDDVRNFLFGAPGLGGLDLASLNIQRGRDHGLPDYNSMRVSFGLSPVTEFSQITQNQDLQNVLSAVYGDVSNIDAWVGALSEDHVSDTSVGPLLMAVIVDQFRRLRDGDRFFCLNDPDLQQPAVRAVINLGEVRLSKIIRKNTSLKQIPKNVFSIKRKLEQ